METTPAEGEFTRMLARSSIGDELRAMEARLRRLVLDDVFGTLPEDDRKMLERLCAEAGGRGLYGFIAPWAAAVAAFASGHPDAPVQHDQPPAPAVPPRAGEWIRDAGSDAHSASWHLFGGDLRLRVVGRQSETFAEARCGRHVAVSGPDGPARLERASERPAIGGCRACRRIDVRLRARRPRRPTG